MFSTDVSNNGVNEAGVYNEGLSSSRFPVVERTGLVVIKVLSKKSGRHKITSV